MLSHTTDYTHAKAGVNGEGSSRGVSETNYHCHHFRTGELPVYQNLTARYRPTAGPKINRKEAFEKLDKRYRNRPVKWDEERDGAF
tara:strand:- start:580 stop:837 length:258 start_codon:yes stop_codon:yes gene_type:complete